MKTTIIIFSVIGLLILLLSIIKYKLTIGKIAECLTIYGIFLGFFIYLDLSPQSVKISKEPSLKISSFEAYEVFSRKGRARSGFGSFPNFSFSAYIINSGDIPITDGALKFKFEYNPPGLKFNNYLKAYIFKGINTKIKYPDKFNWYSDSLGNCEILNLENDDSYQIILPPILTNESFSLIVGYDYKHSDDSIQSYLDKILKGYIELSAYNMGEIVPEWMPDRSSISNYKTKRTKDDLIFDKKKKWFLLQHR
jgi:hypothetical protein